MQAVSNLLYTPQRGQGPPSLILLPCPPPEIMDYLPLIGTRVTKYGRVTLYCSPPAVCSIRAPDVLRTVLQTCSQAPHASSRHSHARHRRDSSHIFCICSDASNETRSRTHRSAQKVMALLHTERRPRFIGIIQTRHAKRIERFTAARLCYRE